MATVTFILSVALLNVGVGFAFATYLGWRYRRLVALEIDSSRSLFPEAEGIASAVSSDEASPSIQPEVRDDDEPSAEAEPPSESPSATPTEGAAEGQPGEALDGQPSATPDATPAPRERGATEVAMTKLRSKAHRYRDQVVDVDTLLRELSTAPDLTGVEACLKSFHQTNEEFLQTRREVYQNLEESQAQHGPAALPMQDLRAAVDAQTEQIESAQAALQSADYQGDLAALCKQMTEHTVQLDGANQAICSTLERGWEAASATEKWQAPEDEKVDDRMPARLASQAALQAALVKWQETKTLSPQPMCMAAIDADRFTRINERYGIGTGDRMLHALAQLLIHEANHDNLVGRASGQRFVLLIPESDLRLATSAVERIRQMVEISHFQYRGEDIRITISCAVIEAGREETLASLFTRADVVIQEAKRYGRNRTFIYEGEYPTPVVPPNFPLEERSIEL